MDFWRRTTARLRQIWHRNESANRPQPRTTTNFRGQDSQVKQRRPFTTYLPRPFRPINALGPRYLELWKDLYACFQQLRRTRDRLEACSYARLRRQAGINSAICDLGRVKHDIRVDHTYVIKVWTDELDQSREARLQLDNEMTQCKADLLAQETVWNETWKHIFEHAQEYLNRCLDVQFEEKWSLKHITCLNFRVILDNHRLLQDMETKLRRLRYESIGATSELKGQNQSEIEKLSATVELSRRAQQIQQEEFMDDAVQGFLLKAGEIPLTPTHGTSDAAARIGNLSRRSSSALDEMDGNNPVAAEDAYLASRDELLQAQDQVGEGWRRLLSQETDHLMTFPKSSHERYMLCIERLLRPFIQDQYEAERRFLEAQQRLQRLGLEVPSSPDLPEERPTGGGLPGAKRLSGDDPETPQSSASFKTRRRKRNIAINDFRTSIIQAAPPEKLPTPPGERDLNTIPENASSGFTVRSHTPSTGRKRRYREYLQDQAALRDQFNSQSPSKRPAYRRDS